MTKQDIFDKLKTLLGEDLYYSYVFYLREFKKPELKAMLLAVQQIKKIDLEHRGTASGMLRDYTKI